MAKDWLRFSSKGFVPLVGLGVVVLAFVPTSFAHMIATTPEQSGPNQRTYSSIIHLEQGWSPEDRLQYYFAPQGSAAMSYDIFLHLEAAGNQGLFRADQNLSRYGLVPHPADPKYNPDALPIGLTKTVVRDGRWKGDWIGMGCAACHNGLIEYGGKRVSISGGNNAHLDINAFIAGLDDALSETVADPQKSARLTERIGLKDSSAREGVLKRLREEAEAIHDYRSRVSVTSSVVGPGRMDALSLIHNHVLSTQLGLPENWVASLAPVKSSFVWNIPQSAWAQWSGVLNLPIRRNLGEALGIFTKMDLTSKTLSEGLFTSTVDLPGQIFAEDLLRRLAPPPWPEEILGRIDREKAAKGKQVFATNCSGCHSTWPHRWSEPKKQGKRFIENAIVPQSVVGTDPVQLSRPQFDLLPSGMAGSISVLMEPPYTGATLAPPRAVFEAIQQGIFDRALADLKLSDEELISAHGYRAFPPEPVEPAPSVSSYKANPAEGLWSSPPFLHNGSVPNLYELLLPAAQRSKHFFVGREFDPVKVGVDTSGNSGKFLLDTSLAGNSNAGHSFEDGALGNGVIGRLLTDEERWALVEYMKLLPNEPRQIAPMGGPAEPTRAWLDRTFFNVQNPGTYNGAPQLSEVPGVGQQPQ